MGVIYSIVDPKSTNIINGKLILEITPAGALMNFLTFSSPSIIAFFWDEKLTANQAVSIMVKVSAFLFMGLGVITCLVVPGMKLFPAKKDKPKSE